MSKRVDNLDPIFECPHCQKIIAKWRAEFRKVEAEREELRRQLAELLAIEREAGGPLGD